MPGVTMYAQPDQGDIKTPGLPSVLIVDLFQLIELWGFAQCDLP